MTTASQSHLADFPSSMSEPQLATSWRRKYAGANITKDAAATEFALEIARDTSRGPLMSSASTAVSSEVIDDAVDTSGPATGAMVTPQLKTGLWSSQTTSVSRRGLTPNSSPGYQSKVSHVTPPAQTAQTRGVPLQQSMNRSQYTPSIWDMRQDYNFAQKSAFFPASSSGIGRVASPPPGSTSGSATPGSSVSTPIPAPMSSSVSTPIPATASSLPAGVGAAIPGTHSASVPASIPTSIPASGPPSVGASIPASIPAQIPTQIPASVPAAPGSIPTSVPVPASQVPNGHTFYAAAPAWAAVDSSQPQPMVPPRSTVPMRSPVLSPTSSNIYSVRKPGLSTTPPQTAPGTPLPSTGNSGISRQLQRQVHNQFPRSGHAHESAATAHSSRTAKKNGRPSTNTELYKTELCASYMSTGGNCPYGEKCQFAHGPEELKTVDRPPKWRSKPCQNWVRTGTCSYNERCCFRHDVPVGQQH